MQKLSIIIPMYNGAKTIERCLDSIFASPEAEQGVEVVVVNDGSVDDSAQVVERYVSAHRERSIALHTFPNGGQSVARNRGIDLARGVYIWFVDCDDTIRPQILPGLLNIIQESKCELVVFGSDLITDSDTRRQQYRSFVIDLTDVGESPISGVDLLQRNILNGSSCFMLWQRAFLEQHKARFYEGILYEDALFVYHYVAYATQICLVPEVGYLYHIDGVSSLRDPRRLVERGRCRLVVGEELLATTKDVVEQHPELRSFYEEKASAFYRSGLRIMAPHITASQLRQYTQRIERVSLYSSMLRGAAPKGKLLIYLAHKAPILYREIVRRMPSVE